MTTLAVGIFEHHTDAALAIAALQNAGMKKKQISVLTRQKGILDQISSDTGIGKTELGKGNEGLFGSAKEMAIALDMEHDTAVAAGAAARKLAGAELPDDRGGDGLAVTLMGLGIPEEDAEKYARHAERKHILVLVTLEEENHSPIDQIFAEHHTVSLDSL